MQRDTLRRASAHRGEVDMAVIYAFFACFVSAGFAFIYFSMLGGSVPVKQENVLEKIIASSAAIQSYAVSVSAVPVSGIPTEIAFEGTATFDIPKHLVQGSFDIPVSNQAGASKVAIEAYSDGAKSVARFQMKNTADGSSGNFPSGFVEINPKIPPPDEYLPISAAGVLTDTLAVFRGHAPVKLKGEVQKENVGASEEAHIVLARDDKASSTAVSSAFETVFSEGDANIWFGTRDYIPKEIKFQRNGYIVTVKIFSPGTPVAITIPEATISASEWGEKRFASSLPQEPVTEIYIGSYGVVKKELIDAVKSAISRATGIRVTVLGAGPALSKSPPLYDAASKKFDGEGLLRSVDAASSKYGKDKRFIYLFDVDLYSSKSGASVWYIDSPASRASIISASGVSAAPALASSRIQKTALHVLGTMLGFSLSPTAANPMCPTYPAAELSELDKQTSSFCSSDIPLLKGIFKK